MLCFVFYLNNLKFYFILLRATVIGGITCFFLETRPGIYIPLSVNVILKAFETMSLCSPAVLILNRHLIYRLTLI